MKYEIYISFMGLKQVHVVHVEDLGLTQRQWDCLGTEPRWSLIRLHIDEIVGDKGWVLEFIKEV